MAVGSAVATVQAAIYAKFTGDAELMALLAEDGVRDQADVPEDQAFPYITLGDIQEYTNDTFTEREYELHVYPHIWTQEKSSKPAQTILARMIKLLHRQPLSLTDGQRHIGTWYKDNQPLQDQDGISQHIVPYFLVLAEEDL
jgi:hypothetical protein